jgi:hypothetical protein
VRPSTATMLGYRGTIADLREPATNALPYEFLIGIPQVLRSPFGFAPRLIGFLSSTQVRLERTQTLGAFAFSSKLRFHESGASK